MHSPATLRNPLPSVDYRAGLFLPGGTGVLAAPTRRIILSFGLVYLAVPFVFCLSGGGFRAYYGYLIYVPLLLAFGHAWSESETLRSPNGLAANRLVFVGAAAVAVMLGLPLRLLLTRACCEVTPRAELMRVVGSHVHADDVVYSEYFTFFESKSITGQVYALFSARGLWPVYPSGLELTQEERKRVNVIIVGSIRRIPSRTISAANGPRWRRLSATPRLRASWPEFRSLAEGWKRFSTTLPTRGSGSKSGVQVPGT